ncbi:MAG TPA: hypothetical protein PLA83_07765 [Deltaproteobacteria bacterium]|nr:hypothetical protein [Deltaproteobacteria bacterium]HQH99673.1 hypothetical protein [Deltaproteobacteria bacterium]HQJ07423.1 hypothetical protein [Deltaproteobacteria bacterium]
MDQKSMMKQAMDFQKETIDNVYKGIISVQEQAEKSLGFFLDRIPWIPEESKNVILEWGKMYKKGRDDFKKAFDDGYDKMESYLVAAHEHVAQQARSAASETRKTQSKASQ